MERSLRCPPETLATRAANALSTGNGLPLAKVSVMVPAGAASGAPPDLLAPRPLHPAAASTPMSASAGQRHAARPRRAVLRRMLPMKSGPLRNHEPSPPLWASPPDRLQPGSTLFHPPYSSDPG